MTLGRRRGKERVVITSRVGREKRDAGIIRRDTEKIRIDGT
jgi:hypothetical protein